MSNGDDKQSSMRERSQTWACEGGGDNGPSPRDDTSPSKLMSKDEIAARPTTTSNCTQQHPIDSTINQNIN